jgi:DNA-binding winged helix-turn-helix (wHTH) protein
MNQKKFYYLLFLVLSIILIWSFSPQENKVDDFSEKAKITLRQVGNQLLLFNKDSTSLILPIQEIKENKFRISFEKELSFEPNAIVEIIKNNIEKTALSKNYRVEVLQCLDDEVGYSYEVNAEEEKTIIPCAGRVLPVKCYIIVVQFLDKSGLKSNKIYLLYILILILAVILYFTFFKKKKRESKIDENKTIIASLVFYPNQNILMQKAKEITLSKKECELLEILVENKNKVVKREVLTKKVWEDNGVFVGRSLDTYISKLRKKLIVDDSIQLINIHGIGYKLEVNS